MHFTLRGGTMAQKYTDPFQLLSYMHVTYCILSIGRCGYYLFRWSFREATIREWHLIFFLETLETLTTTG